MAEDGYKNKWYWYLTSVFRNPSRIASAYNVLREIPLSQDSLTALTAAGGDPVKFLKDYVIPVQATPTPSQGTSTDGFTTIGGILTSVFNGLGTSSTSSISTNEIAPDLSLEQNTATITTSSTPMVKAQVYLLA